MYICLDAAWSLLCCLVPSDNRLHRRLRRRGLASRASQQTNPIKCTPLCRGHTLTKTHASLCLCFAYRGANLSGELLIINTTACPCGPWRPWCPWVPGSALIVANCRATKLNNSDGGACTALSVRKCEFRCLIDWRTRNSDLPTKPNAACRLTEWSGAEREAPSTKWSGSGAGPGPGRHIGEPTGSERLPSGSRPGAERLGQLEPRKNQDTKHAKQERRQRTAVRLLAPDLGWRVRGWCRGEACAGQGAVYFWFLCSGSRFSIQRKSDRLVGLAVGGGRVVAPQCALFELLGKFSVPVSGQELPMCPRVCE